MSGNPCSECAVDGDCCHLNEVAITEADAARLERATGRSRSHFTAVVDGWLLLGDVSGSSECPFFSAGRCSVHASRPEPCRLYPFTAPTFTRAGDLPVVPDTVGCPHATEFPEPDDLRGRMRRLLETLEAERAGRLLTQDGGTWSAP